MDRAVAEDEVGSAGVPAAEAPGILEPVVPVRLRIGATDRIAAARIVDVETRIGDIAMHGGMDARAPARAERGCALFLARLANHDRAAQPVGDVPEACRAVG